VEKKKLGGGGINSNWPMLFNVAYLLFLYVNMYSHNMKGCGLERAAFCQKAQFQPPTTSATAPVFASKYRKFSRARILSWPFFTLRSWDPHQMIPGVKIG
jgi:hypothetical protein